MKIKPFVEITGVILLLVLMTSTCRKCRNIMVKTTDTVYIKGDTVLIGYVVHDTVIKENNPNPTHTYPPNPLKPPKPNLASGHDTPSGINEGIPPYNIPYRVQDSIRTYSSLYTDSTYSITVNDSVVGQLLGQSVQVHIKSPVYLRVDTLRITNNITPLRKPALFIGLNMTQREDKVGFYPTISFEGRKGMLGVGYNPFDKSLMAGYHRRFW